MKNKKIIFLDRDGVINKKPPRGEYVKKWDEFEFLPGVIDGIKILNKKGYKIYIITNQAGIGRGLMAEYDLKDIHKKMEEEFKKNDAEINGIYYCPHEMNEGCECRKPKPGMFLQAAKEHNFNLKDSILIGDEERDFLVGKTIKCKNIFIVKENNFYKIIKKL